jgi:hypothetical protein
MYLRRDSAAGVRFLAAVKEGRGLKPSARAAGSGKQTGYRWLGGLARTRAAYPPPWPPKSSAAPGVGGAGAPGARAARVNPGVEIGVNPDSHPWADAPDGCRAAR